MTGRHQGLEKKERAPRIVMTGTQGQGNKDFNDWTTPRTGKKDRAPRIVMTGTQGQGNKDFNDWTTPRTGTQGPVNED